MIQPLHHPLAEEVLLGLVVASCWMGAIGMWRMREPTQALQYLSLPTTVGVAALTIAAFLEDGAGQVAMKTLLISAILFAINSVGAHAMARAFRARAVGHWEPCDGDPLEFVRDAPSGEGK